MIRLRIPAFMLFIFLLNISSLFHIAISFGQEHSNLLEKAEGLYKQQKLIEAFEIYEKLRRLERSSLHEKILYGYGITADSLAELVSRESTENKPEEKQLIKKELRERLIKSKIIECSDPKCERHIYKGYAYKELLEKYPKGEYADDAEYKLIWVYVNSIYEWEGEPDYPLEELKRWKGFLDKYPHSNLKPQVLFRIGYLQRVLYEIYESLGESTAEEYRTLAMETYSKLKNDYPSTEEGKKAQSLLEEVREGEKVYILE